MSGFALRITDVALFDTSLSVDARLVLAASLDQWNEPNRSGPDLAAALPFKRDAVRAAQRELAASGHVDYRWGQWSEERNFKNPNEITRVSEGYDSRLEELDSASLNAKLARMIVKNAPKDYRNRKSMLLLALVYAREQAIRRAIQIDHKAITALTGLTTRQARDAHTRLALMGELLSVIDPESGQECFHLVNSPRFDLTRWNPRGTQRLQPDGIVSNDLEYKRRKADARKGPRKVPEGVKEMTRRGQGNDEEGSEVLDLLLPLTSNLSAAPSALTLEPPTAVLASEFKSKSKVKGESAVERSGGQSAERGSERSGWPSDDLMFPDIHPVASPTAALSPLTEDRLVPTSRASTADRLAELAKTPEQREEEAYERELAKSERQKLGGGHYFTDRDRREIEAHANEQRTAFIPRDPAVEKAPPARISMDDDIPF